MKDFVLVTPSTFTSQELQQYEQLILDNPRVSEHEVSDFFWKFPKFVAIGGYKRIAREVILYKPNGEAVYRIDFCRCKFGEDLWDFVELKKPQVPFLVKQGGHWRLSSAIQAGVEQAQDYSDFLEEIENRCELEKRTLIRAFRPKVLLIGGRRDNTINREELIRLTSRYRPIDIQTYDDIYQFAKDNYVLSCIAVPLLQPSDLYLPDEVLQKESTNNSYGGTVITAGEVEYDPDYEHYVQRWEERGPRAGPPPNVWLGWRNHRNETINKYGQGGKYGDGVCRCGGSYRRIQNVGPERPTYHCDECGRVAYYLDS